jgi:hypothetical protein
MGLLDWWQNNKPETDSQLSLFEESSELTQHKRVDGATVYKGFQKAISDCGGSEDARKKAVGAETRELFDCTVNELYAGTGGKRGKRETLPEVVQEAYTVNETLSKHRLNEMDNPGGNQQQVDAQIVDTVADTAKQVRGWFPW